MELIRRASRVLGIEAAVRLGACVLVVCASLALGRLGDLFVARERRAPRREARLTRAARRVAATLGRLKGAFTKLGQFAALRYDVLPPAAREALAELHDRVPPLPLDRIAPLIERELGAPLAARFVGFEPEPVGAASIAQVHRARLPGGEPVAVKVQYPWLEASLPADLLVVRGLFRLAFRRRSAADRARLLAEFAAGLREELDFEHEARAAAEIARNLAHDPQVVVPRVHPELSTRRVLTMGWHDAVRVNDRAALARLGVAPRSVLEILARAYAKQVFVDGLFHADPHPGNLFVLDESEAASRPRVLFVDFGLSRRLDPALRRELRLGIHALLKRDLDSFLDGMERMQMIAPGAREGVRRSVAAMFERLATTGNALALGGDQVLALRDEAKSLLERTQGLQLPNDLLLYAKTLSYLFSLGAELDPDVDLMRLSLPYLLQFLGER